MQAGCNYLLPSFVDFANFRAGGDVFFFPPLFFLSFLLPKKSKNKRKKFYGMISRLVVRAVIGMCHISRSAEREKERERIAICFENR
jgi:hypothetical protein